MRFLCLHGHGTNSQIFKTQLAAVRYHLGGGNRYSFVEGTILVPMAPELHRMPSNEKNNEAFFAYFDSEDAARTGTVALAQLDSYLAAEGPFDALLGFSAGATLIATWLGMRHVEGRGSACYCGIRCAVLFSSLGVYDAELLARGQVRLVHGNRGDKDQGEQRQNAMVGIPTAHVWGRDDSAANEAAEVASLCEASGREVYVHEGGHQIPGVKDQEAVKAVVRIIRRTIAKAI